VYLVVEEDARGITTRAVLKDRVLALANYLTASSGAATVKFLGGEN
jgi:hypothetical protein